MQDVEKPYTIIGELKMTFSPELSNKEMMNWIKELSKGIGADGIIGLERGIVEIMPPRFFPETFRRKARHQSLEISSPEVKQGKPFLRGLAIRFR